MSSLVSLKYKPRLIGHNLMETRTTNHERHTTLKGRPQHHRHPHAATQPAMILRYPSATNVLRSNAGEFCFLFPAIPRAVTRNFSQSTTIRAAAAALTSTRAGPGRPWKGYFSANKALESQRTGRGKGKISTIVGGSSVTDGIQPENAPSITTPSQELPHRRRQRERKGLPLPEPADEEFLPPNSSTTLADQASQLSVRSPKRFLSILLSLTKPRLSVLVVLTACATYSLYPVSTLLSPSILEIPSLSPLTLLFLTTCTALCSASANTLNMLYEPKYDALMSRTRNRPLVRGLISPLGAAIFAFVAGSVGVGGLYYGVNPTTAFLGGLNIMLYAGIYTPLKRITVLNTWIGAVVGGIPPLMGWTAAAGQSATGAGGWRELLLGEENAGGWLLASLLVAWQLAHFMSLSWSIRHEYKAAGYRMLCWVNPAMNSRVALRYSVLCIPISFGLCYFGITEWTFAATSLPVNGWLVWEAVKFWKYEGARGSAKGLFWASVWHLPVILVLAMAQKKGLWQRAWRSAMGQPDLDDGEEWEYEEEEPQGKVAVPSSAAVVKSQSHASS